jgi:hypothetical protein
VCIVSCALCDDANWNVLEYWPAGATSGGVVLQPPAAFLPLLARFPFHSLRISIVTAVAH